MAENEDWRVGQFDYGEKVRRPVQGNSRFDSSRMKRSTGGYSAFLSVLFLANIASMATPVAPAGLFPSKMYAVLTGLLDGPAIQRILNSASVASMNGVNSLHILFQSAGGGVGEGICLYNFLRTLPMDVTLYNSGSVQSVATIAYLGAKHRKVSRQAMFMIHRTQTTVQSADTQTIKSLTESAILFDTSTEAILRTHVNIPKEKWSHFDHNDLWFSAEDAVKFGIADEIADFVPPSGAKIFSV